jgi:hypothetical protein
MTKNMGTMLFNLQMQGQICLQACFAGGLGHCQGMLPVQVHLRDQVYGLHRLPDALAG